MRTTSIPRRHSSVRRLSSILVVALVSGVLAVVAPAATAALAGCPNPVVCENQLPGTPQSDWDVDGSGDPTIQGFATQISVNVGNSVQFKVKTDASSYSVEIYRLGYYQGNGARKVAVVSPSAPLPQTQPACVSDLTTEIYDCGTWAVSASWSVPSDAVSGVYLARLYRSDHDDASLIPFIVRNDSSHSQVVFQTSDPTWQAYNTYGQSDFYQGLGNGRAYKVSYNRPFATGGLWNGRDYLFANEYPMIRYLESNGYDVSYISGLDTDTSGGLLTNHNAFLSVGHDEYWSAQQRTNVENARDAGVNLAFFSGNEVYWKTRWEASEDGSATPNRTLVCYKDTWANAKIDPAGPTETWRDPRFGGNGKGPENGLTGTMYMSNASDLPVTVSADEGKDRLWRNTPLASQSAGTSTSLAAHTVGYESDEDLDNGFRPAGLIRMSTSVGPTAQEMQDFGNTVAPGTTTHHLTLYRASSGALVFSAGTIQWSWGLDANHVGSADASLPADRTMRQATMNLLADMGATAATVASDLVASTKTNDTAPPTAVISSPAPNATLGNGMQVTVSGTATDAGGGVVGGVEVSVDNGSSWHPATGTRSGSNYLFSYPGILTGDGAGAIRARAVDDSGNIQPTPASITVSAPCPCTVFGAAVPSNPSVNDATAVTLGTQFTSSANGFVTGIRFYKGGSNTGTHVGTLYKADGTALATATFTSESAVGWQTASFSSAIPITAGVTYVAAYTAPRGNYAADALYFGYAGHSGGVLSALGGQSNPANGVFASGAAFPNQSFNQTNYYVDAVYSPTDSTPLTVTGSTPLAGSSSNPVGTVPTATFSRDIVGSSLSMSMKDAANHVVSGTSSYNAVTRVASFTPAASLANGTSYTVTVSATATGVGPMTPATWSFTTAKPDGTPGVCPCSVFNDSTAPTSAPANESTSVELGMAFSVDAAATVTAIRFYKAVQNTGTHTVSLWDATGNLLATATVSAESTTGWQQASFASPVTIAAGTGYIASYRAPVGNYSADSGGLGTGIDRSPLHTPVGAGRFSYTAAAPLSSSSSNYFVDPVVTIAAPPPPQVASVNPADSSTSVPVTTPIVVTFTASIQPSSATITVSAAGSSVAGTQGNGTGNNQATFTPSASLAGGTKYTVTVSGAKNINGVPMSAPATTSFTTTGACPCTLFSTAVTPSVIDSGDTTALTVGVKFTPSVTGYISGLQFYRASTNTGSHTGSLYTAAGVKLASLTFATQGVGWQTAIFASPVAVTSGTTYVAAVYDPVGHYSVSSPYFNSPYVNGPLTGVVGVYNYGSDSFPSSSYNSSNYWVDVTFTTQNTSPPVVTSKSPDGSALVSPTTKISATFSSGINPGLQFTVTGPGSTAVSGSVTYDSSTSTATFTPSVALSYGSTFTASVKATGTNGVAMASAYSWPFGTIAQPGGGSAYSLFGPADVPTTASWPDSGPLSLGVTFRSDVAGSVTAVKFYAGAGNSGPQPVAIWSATGTQLGSGTSSGTVAGWRTITLKTPVPITAGTSYVASYTAPTGHYSVTSGGLANGVNSGFLHIPAGGGAYAYPGGFPASPSSTNYYVDVVVVVP